MLILTAKVRKLLLLGIVIGVVTLLAIWHFRYRKQIKVSFGNKANIQYKAVEGYTDKFCYLPEDTVTVYLRSESQQAKGVLRKISGPYKYQNLDTFAIGKEPQPLNHQQAEEGCNWTPTLTLPVTYEYGSGYYNLHLTGNQDTANVTFLVRNTDKPPEIAVLAPVSTWVAYNSWGGKSLYHNKLDSTNVYKVSAKRPLNSLNYSRKRRKQSIHVEAQIFNWFNKRYQTALFPDYSLENPPTALEEAEIIVLAYHCEYFSKAMYDHLEHLVYTNGTPLISLGANQIYNKIQWHWDKRQMECHKNLTLFDNWAFGGPWKHNLRSEANFLGVRYSPAGLHTYAPFKVKKPDHWLFAKTSVKKGDLFGQKGINAYPLSGYETDKTTYWSRGDVKVLAKGLNPENGPYKAVYQPDIHKNWQGQGGGMMTLKNLSKEHAILCTGAIQSGSGLGTDAVFTQVIKNFVNRYQ